MRRLLLLRHAKSDWSDPELSDEQRPLNDRGRRARRTIARHIADADLAVELVTSSPARRARDTAEPVALALGLPVEIDDRLYAFDAHDVLDVVRSLPDEIQTVLLVGHNPAFEDLAAHLTGEDARFTTATVAVIELATDAWRSVDRSTGSLVHLASARDLDAGDEP